MSVFIYWSLLWISYFSYSNTFIISFVCIKALFHSSMFEVSCEISCFWTTKISYKLLNFLFWISISFLRHLFSSYNILFSFKKVSILLVIFSSSCFLSRYFSLNVLTFYIYVKYISFSAYIFSSIISLKITKSLKKLLNSLLNNFFFNFPTQSKKYLIYWSI